VSRIAEGLVPSRLGRAFRRLVVASWTSNVGDGIALAVGPLLVSSQTHEPFLIALAAVVTRVPHLLFGPVRRRAGRPT